MSIYKHSLLALSRLIVLFAATITVSAAGFRAFV